MGWIDDYGKGGGRQEDCFAGRHTARIMKAFETKSKAGNNMIRVEMESQGKRLCWFIVEGLYFDKNANKLFSAFGIKAGNFDFDTWAGKSGEVELERDGMFYRVADLVEKECAPETNGETGASPFTDDIPF